MKEAYEYLYDILTYNPNAKCYFIVNYIMHNVTQMIKYQQSLIMQYFGTFFFPFISSTSYYIILKIYLWSKILFCICTITYSFYIIKSYTALLK